MRPTPSFWLRAAAIHSFPSVGFGADCRFSVCGNRGQHGRISLELAPLGTVPYRVAPQSLGRSAPDGAAWLALCAPVAAIRTVLSLAQSVLNVRLGRRLPLDHQDRLDWLMVGGVFTGAYFAAGRFALQRQLASRPSRCSRCSCRLASCRCEWWRGRAGPPSWRKCARQPWCASKTIADSNGENCAPPDHFRTARSSGFRPGRSP